ncbi:MAG: GntR family transcriptional regulator [Acidobacteria bacterium]|nr:GntR family transcriptional regulator [Acidobacteriota bacterium]
MQFKLNLSAGQPLYAQLVQQVRHGIETGVLQDGDVLPGIRTLAETLAVGHNTIAKAYSELEHEGLLELRQGLGAYITARRRQKSRAELLRSARESMRAFVASLRDKGLTDEEILRLAEAEILYSDSLVEGR